MTKTDQMKGFVLWPLYSNCDNNKKQQYFYKVILKKKICHKNIFIHFVGFNKRHDCVIPEKYFISHSFYNESLVKIAKHLRNITEDSLEGLVQCLIDKKELQKVKNHF